MDPAAELHELEPEEFERQVRSFDHWFGAVQDYLSGLKHGHRSDLEETRLPEAETQRLITALCNYVVAETAALEASSGLVRIAPNRQTQIFLATQVADEARHVEVMLDRLRDLGVNKPEAEVQKRAAQTARDFKRRLLDLVDAKQWDAAIFAQNVALEAMEFSVFRAHADVADPVTKDMLERILCDERRHIGFGENEIGRRLRGDPKRAAWIQPVKEELEGLVMHTFEETAQQLGLSRDMNARLAHDYRDAIRRLGF
jgi:1,2-phenylacetyl-CoA epoxidase catalytic subunit